MTTDDNFTPVIRFQTKDGIEHTSREDARWHANALLARDMLKLYGTSIVGELVSLQQKGWTLTPPPAAMPDTSTSDV